MQITLLALADKARPVAQQVKAALEAEGASVSLMQADDCTAEVFAQRGFYIILTSATAGTDPTEKLAHAVEQARPNLAGEPDGFPLDYAIIEVEAGDATAAPRLDPVLAGLGAHRVGHTALTGTAGSESAITAAEGWVRKLLRDHEGDEDPTLMS